MSKYFTTGTTIVSAIGHEDDYVNLPIVKDDKAVGIVRSARKVYGGYELTILFFNQIEVETQAGMPSVIFIN